MKSKLLFGAGIAAGYVLGSRSGRAAYDKLKARATSIWDSKPVQDKVTAATEVVKEKAPEVGDQLSEAARRAGTVLSSAIHRDASKSADATSGGTPASGGTSVSGGTSASATSTSGPGTSGTSASTGAGAGGETLDSGHVPAHSTHPETVNLGTTADVESDPARNDAMGQDWSDEGGATDAGAATKRGL
jgi:hypothetical protein